MRQVRNQTEKASPLEVGLEESCQSIGHLIVSFGVPEILVLKGERKWETEQTFEFGKVTVTLM